jgi:hypothetical protein
MIVSSASLNELGLQYMGHKKIPIYFEMRIFFGDKCELLFFKSKRYY